MQRKMFLSTTIALATCMSSLLGIPSSVMAGPALYWWYLYPNVSQSQCLNRAIGSMAVEKVPIIKKDNSGVVGSNKDATASIACIRRGSDLQAIIIVSSQDGKYAQYLLEMFKTSMSSGILE